MNTRRDIEAATGRRVYEYEGSDGVIYYSFNRQTTTFSDPVRLKIKSRIGTHLVNFLVRLRRLGVALDVIDNDVG